MFPNDPNAPRDGASSGATPDRAVPNEGTTPAPRPEGDTTPLNDVLPTTHVPEARDAGARDAGPLGSYASDSGARTADPLGASSTTWDAPARDPGHVANATGAASQAAAGASRAGAFARQGAWVAIVLTVIGGLVAVGTLGQSIWQSSVAWPRAVAAGTDDRGAGWDGPWNAGWGPGSGPLEVVFEQSIAVDGVTAVDIDGRSSEYMVEYGDVVEAQLTVESTSDRNREWTFEVDGTTLTVEEHDDTSVQPWGNERTRVTLTLPESLEPSTPDLAVEMRSGAIDIGGDFGAVDIDVQSGAGNFAGAAATIAVDVQSGAGNVTATGATNATLSVGSGVLHAELRGPQPQAVTLDVQSGLGVATVPAGAYAVSGDVSSGLREIGVQTDPAATSTLVVNVASGAATVNQPGS